MQSDVSVSGLIHHGLAVDGGGEASSILVEPDVVVFHLELTKITRRQ